MKGKLKYFLINNKIIIFFNKYYYIKQKYLIYFSKNNKHFINK